MLARLRDQVAVTLAGRDSCVLSTSGRDGMWAIPVRCHATGLDVECLVPRWSDPAHFLSGDPELLLLFPGRDHPATEWIQYRGRVAHTRPTTAPSPDGSLGLGPFVHVYITPSRIDLVDESRGWGVLESLEIENLGKE